MTNPEAILPILNVHLNGYNNDSDDKATVDLEC
jgi:hypothetical protein